MAMTVVDDAELMRNRPVPASFDTTWTWSGYSLAERDRRWTALRARAAAEGLDCLFVPLGDGYDGRYLTQYLNAAVVLPTDGRPPAVLTSEHEAGNAWITEPRRVRNEWGPAMAEALLEAGMGRGRIGVAGLKGGAIGFARTPDGVVNHTAYAEVHRRLPSASFVDATDLVVRVRSIKSEEELTCMRRAVAIAEAGLDQLVELARPGVDGNSLYARVMERMLELGTEYYNSLGVTIDPIGARGTHRYLNPPIPHVLQPNDLVATEANTLFGGQATQEQQLVVLGPIPDLYRSYVEMQRELFEGSLALLKPGATFGEVVDYILGYGKGRGVRSLVMIKGPGLGEDGPFGAPTTVIGPEARAVQFEAGNALVWKPTIYSEDMRTNYIWGGCVIVHEDGPEVVGKRGQELISVH
jgi:Xaa-Pro aminopeptidase